MKGVNNGLHSRAAPLLKLLLQQDLLTPAHLQAQQAQQAAALMPEQVRAVSAAVTGAALDQLLHHLRRGKGQALWECVLSEAHARLETCLSSGTSFGGHMNSFLQKPMHVCGLQAATWVFQLMNNP